MVPRYTPPIRSAQTRALPLIWLISEGGALPDALPQATGVLLRGYDRTDRPARAAALARTCRARGLVLVIAGDWRLALDVGADGLHLPEWLVARPRLWRRARPDWIVTGAAHSRPAVWRARTARLDAVLISPVFPTASHPGARPLGPMGFAALARAADTLPVYALGGLTARRFERIAPMGAAGWAGISAFG